MHPQVTRVRVGDVVIGGENIAVIAGPCAVESLEQALTIAREVKRAGAALFRGGAFKPRTSPYSFQGLKDEGLALLVMARAETGLPVVVAEDPLTCVARGGGKMLELIDEHGPGLFGLD